MRVTEALHTVILCVDSSIYTHIWSIRDVYKQYSQGIPRMCATSHQCQLPSDPAAESESLWPPELKVPVLTWKSVFCLRRGTSAFTTPSNHITILLLMTF